MLLITINNLYGHTQQKRSKVVLHRYEMWVFLYSLAKFPWSEWHVDSHEFELQPVTFYKNRSAFTVCICSIRLLR